MRGTNRKPWRQKGTGRARAGGREVAAVDRRRGDLRSKPRSYGYRLPRKAKRTAMRSISPQEGARGSASRWSDGLDADSGKTRDLARQLEPITGAARCVMAARCAAPMLVRAARNILGCGSRACHTVTAHDC